MYDVNHCLTFVKNVSISSLTNYFIHKKNTWEILAVKNSILFALMGDDICYAKINLIPKIVFLIDTIRPYRKSSFS